MAKGVAAVIALLGAVALAIAVWFGAQTSPEQTSAETTGYQYRAAPCNPALADWECGQLLTPDGFELAVRRLAYKGEDKKAAPLFYLQGGPGLDADFSESGLRYWESWRDYAQLKRDLIVMQRRGTDPQSSLRCRGVERLGKKFLAQSIPPAQESRIAKKALLDCIAAKPLFDPQAFGTRHNFADLQALIEQLGLSQFHLFGVSYGSRLAIAAAATPGLQTLVLDSVYPPDAGGVASWPVVLGQAIDRFASACGSQPECVSAWQQAYPDVPLNRDQFISRLQSALEYLARLPVKVDIALDGLPQRVLVSDHRFIAALFAASYRRDRWSLAIRAMAGARKRDREAIAPLIERYANQVVSKAVNSLAFLAVDCRDNPIGLERDYRQLLVQRPLLKPYLESAWQDQICHDWPLAEPPHWPRWENDVGRPKVVIVAGEFDPITPARWAEGLAQRWPQSQLTQYSGIGHGVMGEKPCALAQLESVLSGQSRAFAVCD
ncbi:alpha/beta hydrolase [Gilvimarinus xylanilyticus]|uniref:Alpha/beta hydrolase n=1 Tax=Gilvimarinus xylanilyticus TaxID=2944139 RepID=A0A9X2KT44_9GAMM|nr:alpha/beta hydrolase [Gilvimarinus xylanilyticus]MCP8898889.1 alpha/beta hydrolase [Gilvimarinus xylanilyticus]